MLDINSNDLFPHLKLKGRCYEYNNRNPEERCKINRNCAFYLDNEDIRIKPAVDNDFQFEHLVILGNALTFNKHGSLVFGVPYAWIGKSFKLAYSQELRELRVGTIGKFDIKSKTVIIPKAHADPSGPLGAVWGSGSCGKDDIASLKCRNTATTYDPLENRYTGTSIVRGEYYYVLYQI